MESIARAGGRVDDRRDGGDLAVLDQQAAVRQVGTDHGLDVRISDQKHFVSPFTARRSRSRFIPLFTV